MGFVGAVTTFKTTTTVTKFRNNDGIREYYDTLPTGYSGYT